MTPFERAGALRLLTYARALAAEPDEFRVLRRLPRAKKFWLTPGRPDITIGIVDIEITGLGDDDEIFYYANEVSQPDSKSRRAAASNFATRQAPGEVWFARLVAP